jgi:hypothetical protein
VLDYNKRLQSGKASKIKPNHLEKILRKLRTKEAELEAEIAHTKDGDSRSRLEKKLRIAREHIARGEWLMGEINSGSLSKS